MIGLERSVPRGGNVTTIDRNWITVRLFGGLGNQLFQYAAGKRIALELGTNLRVDNSWILDGFGHEGSHISNFQLYKPDFEVSIKHSNLQLSTERIKTILARNSEFASNFLRINAPKDYTNSDLSNIQVGMELRGYYQSPKHFLNLKSEAIITDNDFKLRNESSIQLPHYGSIMEQNYIAVHVRGSDYLKKNSRYLRLDVEYYNEALHHLKNRLGELPIYVFTDDERYAMLLLGNVKDLFFPQFNKFTAAENMKMIANAKGIVVANSTFSYWAGLISSNETTKVAPERWSTARNQPSEFFPADWVVI